MHANYCQTFTSYMKLIQKLRFQFVYESEKDNAHNQLLKQIQKGVFLKRVKCNDRSKPNLEGKCQNSKVKITTSKRS